MTVLYNPLFPEQLQRVPFVLFKAEPFHVLAEREPEDLREIDHGNVLIARRVNGDLWLAFFKIVLAERQVVTMISAPLLTAEVSTFPKAG